LWAGIVWFSDYKELGLTREQAIAEIELSEDRVWLAEVLPGGGMGALVEQPLMRTSFKDTIHDVLGHIVYQHRAFIAQLSAGEYLSF